MFQLSRLHWPHSLLGNSLGTKVQAATGKSRKGVVHIGVCLYSLRPEKHRALIFLLYPNLVAWPLLV
jgi:hypothetical protein